ncbi:hypothetical protein N8T08_006921 [Aspergillus melleus]|uniref:Uncharacterized protein n=1 Tax=Aspergillus melleus TaxID=138277 RepID=A0ACC3AZ81_9EURO|nr:hypothetical protein N8T08_006921 [Aspergillus melleus]
MATSAVVLDAILSADLSPTEHLILKHFIEAADDSELAARYLHSRLHQSEDVETLTSFDSIPEHLDTLVCRRDGPYCSLSRNEKGDPAKAGAESAYIIPPSFVQNVESNESPENEPNALKLVEKYTSIPAPSLVDVGEHDGNTYMVMTHIPGQSLAHVGHLMSYAERDRFADDLAACVKQLRTIPNNTPYKFGDTRGGPIIDHRIPDDRGGPFNTEADFNNHLVSHLACNIFDAVDGLPIRQDHRSFFTHGDFHATNLLVEGGRLSGIIDWECAGYLPEYWESTKAMYTSNWKPIQQAIFYRVFGHEYDDELAAERKLWALTPFGV